MIGENIVKAREKAGLKQIELAEKIGISRHLLYKYEKNIITNVPSDKIEKIAAVCGVTPMEIMGWYKVPLEQYHELKEYIKDSESAFKLKAITPTFSMLTPEHQDQIIKYIEFLADLEAEEKQDES